MKNKISDLRDHMFAALERLGNEDLTPEELQKEIDRSRAVSEVGKVIVESAKTQVLFARMTRNRDEEPTKFLEEAETPPMKRIKGDQTNKSPMGIANAI